MTVDDTYHSLSINYTSQQWTAEPGPGWPVYKKQVLSALLHEWQRPGGKKERNSSRCNFLQLRNNIFFFLVFLLLDRKSVV